MGDIAEENFGPNGLKREKSRSDLVLVRKTPLGSEAYTHNKFSVPRSNSMGDMERKGIRDQMRSSVKSMSR